MKEVVERIELIQVIEIDVTKKYIFAMEGPIADYQLHHMKVSFEKLWNDIGQPFLICVLPKGHKVKLIRSDGDIDLSSNSDNQAV